MREIRTDAATPAPKPDTRLLNEKQAAEMTPKIDFILRSKEVTQRTGLAKTTLYRRMEEGTFPRAKRLGANSVGWLESEIAAWINSLETA